MAAHEHPSQSFQTGSPARTIAIPTRLDIKTGLRIILWRDIQQIFEGAKAILNNGEAVLFLTDDNFEYLNPLRIAHHPGVILEVVDANTINDGVNHTRDQVPEPHTSTAPSSQQSGATSGVSSPSANDETLHVSLSLPETTGTPANHAQPVSVDGITEIASQSEGLSVDTDGDPLHTSQEPAPVEPRSQIPISNSPEQDVHEPVTDTLVDAESVSQPDNMSVISVSSPTERMIVVQAGFTTVYVQPSIHGYRQLRNSYIDAINNGQLTQATVISDAMNELYENLQTELTSIRDTQVAQELEVQRGLVETQQNVAEEVVRQSNHSQQQPEEPCYQQQPIDIQQHADDQQQEQQPIQQVLSEISPEIRDSILSVISQNYELHEYQFPRLFIVLPKEIRGANKITKSTVVSCRLYFLCECVDHTTPEMCTTPEYVHVANHHGYDIAKPDEFFQKYGRYVLAQMYMIKYGVMATNLNVPPLRSSKIIEGLDIAQGHLDFVKRNMEVLVNESIEFLQDLTRNSDDGVTNGDFMRLDKIEIMEGADRRALKWYLNVESNDRGFGGLHRIITPVSHVKWVCKDHNLADDPGTDARALAEMRKENGEVFDTELREVTFRRGWDSSCGYRHLLTNVNVQRIQKFRITLSPQEAAYSSHLIKSVRDANVVDLAVDKISNPIDLCQSGAFPSLMSNGRLQTLRILTSDPYTPWQGLSAKAPKMRVVEFQGPLGADSNGQTMYSLGKFLGYCPNLVYLGLRLSDQSSLVNFMTAVIPNLKNLKCLELYYGKYYLSVDITQGKIKTLHMHLPFTKHIIFQDAKIPEYSQVFDEALGLKQLAEILSKYPSINDIEFRYQELEIRDIIDASARQSTPSGYNGNTSTPRRLVLIQGFGHHNPSLNTIVAEYGGTGMDTHVRIGQSDKTNGFKYAEIFCHYGWTFKTLRIMNGALNDHLAILLDQSSQEKGSRIRTLVVDLKSLSAVGLNFVDQVIRRSNDLEEFTVICSTSDILRDRESAHWFLTQHSKVLTGLEMKLSDPDELKLWPEQVFLSKGSLSGLTDLQLTLQGVQALDDPHPFVQRLVEMVTSSSPSSATIDAALKKSSGRPKDTPETRSLKRFCLRGAVLTRDEWKWILEAIDLSTMEELDFQDTNFSSEEFKILARCFETLGSVLLLKNLDLKGTTLGGTVPVALRGKFESMVSEGIHISLI